MSDSNDQLSHDSSRRRVGSHGEQLAAEFLQQEGWRIRARNFETKHGEIDIVAETQDRLGDERIPVVAFVEVKTRRGGPVLPELAVHAKKRQKLVFMGKLYRNLEGPERASFRFDVIAVNLEPDPPDIQHYPSAFDVLSRLN